MPVTDGHCKLQWRADWALRWAALDVDYEMSGKDLIDSVKLSSKICRVLDGRPPDGFSYEHFLDPNGEKISKSRGNGLTIDEWLRYGTKESLMLFLYREPRAAKRLFFDVIPRNVDEYAQFLAAYPRQAIKERLGNPVWHIHAGQPPAPTMPEGLSFGMLLNLASVVNAEEPEVLWRYISHYAPAVTPASAPALDALVARAVAYYQDRVRPFRRFRAPDTRERAALAELRARLAALPETSEAEAIQSEVYAIGKAHGFEPLRAWFQALYEVLLGQSEGPRFGSFVAIFGIANSCALIDAGLAREATDAVSPVDQGTRRPLLARRGARRQLGPAQAGARRGRRARRAGGGSAPAGAGLGPTRGARDPGPGAGPRASRLRRGLPGASAATAPGGARPRLRPPARDHGAAPAGPARPCRPAASALSAEEPGASPTCCAWGLPSSCSSAPRRMPPWARRCAWPQAPTAARCRC